MNSRLVSLARPLRGATVRSINVGTNTWQSLSASRRATCDSGGTPGTSPASCSGVWSASGMTITQVSRRPQLQPFAGHVAEGRPAYKMN